MMIWVGNDCFRSSPFLSSSSLISNYQSLSQSTINRLWVIFTILSFRFFLRAIIPLSTDYTPISIRQFSQRHHVIHTHTHTNDVTRLGKVSCRKDVFSWTWRIERHKQLLDIMRTQPPNWRKTQVHVSPSNTHTHRIILGKDEDNTCGKHWVEERIFEYYPCMVLTPLAKKDDEKY